MSNKPDKPELSDRDIIEARRDLFLRRIEREDLERTHEWIAKSGVCLSLNFKDGETLLKEGEWSPHPESQALARDPRSPVDLLVHLARHWPGEVLANPALDLGLLEQPNALQQAAPETLLSLAQHPDAPPPLLASLLVVGQQHLELRQAIAVHPATPKEVLQGLTNDPGEEVRKIAETRLARG